MPTTETPSNAIARLHFRLPSEAKEKIERAAVASGLSVTDFAVHALVNTADEVLERQQTRRLSDRDRDVFLALLDADDDPNEALKSAFRARRDLIAE
jgi:uncharacterized protein (DUF1778 family)